MGKKVSAAPIQLQEGLVCMKIQLTKVEKIELFLWLYRSENYKNVVLHDGFVFRLKENGWVPV